MAAKSAGSTPTVQALMIDQALRSSASHGSSWWYWSGGHRTDAALPEISVPTTVISGDAGRVSTDIHSRAVAAAVPHAKLIALEGVDHMVQQTAR